MPIIDLNVNENNQFRLPSKYLEEKSSERDMRDFLSFFINASVLVSNETEEAKGRIFPIYKPLQKSILGLQSVNIFKNLGGVSFKTSDPDNKFLVKPSLSEKEFIEKALLPIVDGYIKLNISANSENTTDEND